MPSPARRIRCLYGREAGLQRQGKHRVVAQLVQPVVVVAELLDQHAPPGRVQQVLQEMGQSRAGDGTGPSTPTASDKAFLACPHQPVPASLDSEVCMDTDDKGGGCCGLVAGRGYSGPKDSTEVSGAKSHSRKKLPAPGVTPMSQLELYNRTGSLVNVCPQSFPGSKSPRAAREGICQ